MAVTRAPELIRLVDPGTDPTADASTGSARYLLHMVLVVNNLRQRGQRAPQWAHDRPAVVGVGYAALIAALGIVDLAIDGGVAGARAPDPLAVVLIVLGSAALIWRRTAPILALAMSTAALLVFFILGYGPDLAAIGLSAVYAVAAHENHRRSAWIAIATASIILVVTASIDISDGGGGFAFLEAATRGLYLGGAAAVGAVIRNRQQIFLTTRERAESAEADRTAAAERAATQERLRIAREMHDIVAHGISLISVQAAAAQAVARSDPDRTTELLRSIEATGRDSLAEMRRMLGVLRSQNTAGTEQEPVGRSPQPTLDDLSSTIELFSNAGLKTRLTIEGAQRKLPAGIELAAFRVVQEALTNVLRHGGGNATAVVNIRYTPESVHLVISNTGHGPVPAVPGRTDGQGLIGMRERVDAYNGELATGPMPGGGFRVTAVLPVESTPRHLTVRSATQSDQVPT